MFHVIFSPQPVACRSVCTPESFHSARAAGRRSPDFNEFSSISRMPPGRLDGRFGDEPAVSFKSVGRCPGGFHRFQEIQTSRFTLSTGTMYDLYTTYGQSVDKKTVFSPARNYPQVHPQPDVPLYRGFQVHKTFTNQIDNAFFHQIWRYHHHHALDLYPDLEARQDPIRHERALWTVASAGPATTALKHEISFARRNCPPSTLTENLPEFWQWQPKSIGPFTGGAASELLLLSSSRQCSTWNQKKRPGRSRASFGSTWNSATVRDAAASPRGATSHCWIHAPAPRSSSRAAE